MSTSAVAPRRIWPACFLALGCSAGVSASNSDGGNDDGTVPRMDCSMPPQAGPCGAVCSNGNWAVIYCLTPPEVAEARLPQCGDGVVSRNEGCDDGNSESLDGCNHLCQLEANWECPSWGGPCRKTAWCGDGSVTSDETCDDGNTVNGDGCSADCRTLEAGFRCRKPGAACAPICGDGLILGSEACDDGNTRAGDGCSRTCQREPDVCAALDGGGCDAEARPICGDGVVSYDEACDDGSDVSRPVHNDDRAYGGCTTSCHLGAHCGDGVVNGPEECDWGDANGIPHGEHGCTAACTVPHTCGDGIVDVAWGEECEPRVAGEVVSGCSDDCKLR